MTYRFCIADVFTQQRFGGNQLAVLPNAQGLTGAQMQRIAREFNFSESAFVLPAQNPANTRWVRIFTPQAELEFAGHPNIGSAYVLAALGEIPLSDQGVANVQFEEAAGIVAISIECESGAPVSCELQAPQALKCRGELSAAEVAEALGLVAGDIVTDKHAPTIASVGLEFLFVELPRR